MTAKNESLDGFFSPSDLAFIEAVVSEVSRKSGRMGEDERNSFIAAAAVELYQNGINDHRAMVDRLSAL